MTKNNTTAILIMCMAMLIVPLMDVLAKFVATHHPVSPASITFFRFAGQSLLLLPIVIAVYGFAGLSSKAKLWNLFRGALMGWASMLFFVAVKYLPLADAIAIFFVEPMIVMALSVPLLGERVGWRRVLAALVGFGGALLVIQPSYAVFGAKSLLPLATAVLFSFYLILSRKLGSFDRPLAMQLWSGLGGVIGIALVFLVADALDGSEISATLFLGDFAFTWPFAGEAIIMIATIAAISTIGHLLIVIAFSRASDSAVVAPFQYAEIITATFAGYLVFGDFPNALKWLGITIIIASGLYIFFREKKAERLSD